MLLAACESSTVVQVQQPMLVRLTPFTSAAVAVTSPSGQYVAVTGDLKMQLTNDLRNAAVFRSVADAVEAGEGVPADRVNVMVTINDVREVGQRLRWYAGPLAGQAKIVADVQVLGARSGTVIGQARFEALSQSDNTYSGTTQDVVKQLSSQIVAWLAAYK